MQPGLRVLSTLPPCLLVVWLTSPVRAADPAAAAGEEVRVVCPAIEEYESRSPEDPTEPRLPISLVALGRIKLLKATGDNRVYEMMVEKVLYGATATNAFLFSTARIIREPQPTVGVFTSTEEDEKPFQLADLLPAEEEKGQLALSAARLDFQVLSARCIFIGIEERAISSRLRKVKIGHSLSGPVPEPGQTIMAEFPGYAEYNFEPSKLPKEERIYIVRSVQSGRKTFPPLADELSNETIYTLTTVLRSEQEEQIRGALGRRDAYPLSARKEGGKQEHTREIIFQGSIPKAIELLGSASQPVVALGADTLRSTKDPRKATEAIASLVEKDMLQFAPGEEHTYRLLRNSIRTLSQIGEGMADGELGKLLRQFMAFAESSRSDLPPLPHRTPYAYYWSDEEEMVDANHTLAWLLMAMNEQEVSRHFARDLVRLREKASPEWKREVQLALDAAHVEDVLQLDKAKTAAKDARSLLISPSVPATGDGIAFSHDGRFLACGNSVWNLSDWSKAGGFSQDGSIEQLLFSPDDKFLYVIGGSGLPIHKRFDWRSGKVDKAFEGHKGGLFYAALVPDGSKMVTASYYEDIVHVWDLATGKITNSFPLAAHCHGVALSPDGLMLARQTSEYWLSIDRLTGGVVRTLGLPPADLCVIGFSSDGAYLVVSMSEFGRRTDRLVRLLVYDTKKDFALLANKTIPAEDCEGMSVSADSRRVVFRDKNGRAWAASLPDLASVKPLISAQGDQFSKGIAFSPDGKLLAFASRYDAIQLFNAETLEPIESASGHARHVASVYFSADGKTLRSVGTDNVICSWNTSSAKPEQRLQLPPHTVCVSVRPSDGRYALCASAADVEAPFWESKKEIPPVKVLDLADGKVASEVALPVNWPFNTTRVLWLNEPEALCLADFRLRRFNYLTGAVQDYGHSRLYGDVSEDGRAIYRIDGGGKVGSVSVGRSAIETGELTPLGQADLPRMTGNFRGLVPGGKRFYMANPGVYIFDRTPVKLISEKRLKDWHLLRLCFSPDGGCYAFAATREKRDASADESYEPAETLVRVHQTMSGYTLLAFPAHSRGVRDLKFSPDGEHLAIVSSDGFIELRHLNLAKSP